MTAKRENDQIVVTPLACHCIPSNQLIALVHKANQIILPAIPIREDRDKSPLEVRTTSMDTHPK